MSERSIPQPRPGGSRSRRCPRSRPLRHAPEACRSEAPNENALPESRSIPPARQGPTAGSAMPIAPRSERHLRLVAAAPHGNSIAAPRPKHLQIPTVQLTLSLFCAIRILKRDAPSQRHPRHHSDRFRHQFSSRVDCASMSYRPSGRTLEVPVKRTTISRVFSGVPVGSRFVGVQRSTGKRCSHSGGETTATNGGRSDSLCDHIRAEYPRIARYQSGRRMS